MEITRRMGLEWFAWGTAFSLLTLIFMKVYLPDIELSRDVVAGVALPLGLIGNLASEIGVILMVLYGIQCYHRKRKNKVK